MSSVLALICSHDGNGPGSGKDVVLRGHFTRKSDGVRVQQYHCHRCRRSFSQASFSECFGQKKRQLNGLLLELLVSGISQRRAAVVLRVNRKTVVRKFIRMGERALVTVRELGSRYPKVDTMEFDDLETFEHSKCKPLSVTLAVEYKTRRILGFRVSEMPSKGKLAQISRKKYGPRRDERGAARHSLFLEIKDQIKKGAKIKSDQNPHYAPDVRLHFPDSFHETHKGRRGCVVGQGELKRGGFDPLFSLNHTCAMLRANINRLFRRTWCTTKRKERLNYHIAIYTLYHNLTLIPSVPI